MRSFLDSICSSCDTCIRNKTRITSNFGFLDHLGPADAPFHIMSLDTIGGFGGRHSSKRYLHLLVDHFTRFSYILTSKNQNSDEFIKLLENVQKDKKIKILLTDQYGGFTSKEFESYLESQNIEHIFTAVDCPFSNGLNERLNQTLVNRIRCKINEYNRNRKKQACSTIAQQCISEYNDTLHSVTGFPPNYLMNGVYASVLPTELAEVRNFSQDTQTAFLNSKTHHNKNKERYDRSRKNISLVSGDYVYIENGNRLNREKLDEIRIGPFRIEKKIPILFI